MNKLSDQFSDDNEIERLRRERAEQEWRSAVDRLIDEAQEKGAFDNLPGKGRPLNLKKNPYASDRSLAYDLLQNNNYTLPWIAERQELLAEIDAFRQEWRRRWQKQQARRRGTADPERAAALRRQWQTEVEEMTARLRELNQAIADLNLTIPVTRLELFKLTLAGELARIGAKLD